MSRGALRVTRTVGGVLLVLLGVIWVLATTIPIFLIASSGTMVVVLLAIDLAVGLLCVVLGIRFVRRGLAPGSSTSPESAG